MKYWYKFFVGECPVCGRDCSYRKRMPLPKPVDSKNTVEYIPDSETYDWCDI